MRVTSNGENVPNVMYLKAGAVGRPYSYTLKEEELFSVLVYPINSYEISVSPAHAWLQLSGRNLEGTPTYTPGQTFPVEIAIKITA